MIKKRNNQYHTNTLAADRALSITYYTDPLCCWSWVFEPVWEALKHTLADQAHFRYCMGGMLPSWDGFYDNVNDVSKPIQMGSVFMQASHMTGQKINSRIWYDDPPGSSYPACVAVKAAALQSDKAAEHYLKALRHALMVDGLNIAKREVLIKVAFEMADILNTEKFLNDLSGQTAITNFKKDIQEVTLRNIRRFPTLVITTDQGQGVLMVGNRPLDAIMAGIRQLSTTMSEL